MHKTIRCSLCHQDKGNIIQGNDGYLYCPKCLIGMENVKVNKNIKDKNNDKRTAKQHH